MYSASVWSCDTDIMTNLTELDLFWSEQENSAISFVFGKKRIVL